jgi:hypothetical protein
VRYDAGPHRWLLPGHLRGHLEEIQSYVADYFSSPPT